MNAGIRSAAFSLSLVLTAIIAACGGPGAGKSTFESGDVKQEGSSGKTISDDDDSADDDDNASSSSSGAAGDEVFGTKAYAFKAPAQNANAHNDATHAGKTPLDGKDCVTAGCHLDLKVWAFAGTVYSGSKTSTTTATDVEVGVVYADNTVKIAMTDANGNFWLDSTDFPPANAKVGVRGNGKPTQMMNLPLPAAPGGRACNSDTCHGSTGNRIFVQ